MDKYEIHIPIPKDEKGFLGRECLECKRYFKLKPGTGLPTNYCHCPYCSYEGNSNTFFTPDQLKYAYSVGMNRVAKEVIKPLIDQLGESFKRLEDNTRGSLLPITVTVPEYNPSYQIEYYDEEELETDVVCNSCSLEFSIYGVFSRCPDCKELNAFLIFRKSLEVCRKQFYLIKLLPAEDLDIIHANLKYILSNAISAFDGLGKELRNQYTGQFPNKPKNLFQNIDELEKVLMSSFQMDVRVQLTDYDFLRKMFQVRHILEHNMGVVDSDFVKKVPALNLLLGRKYPLTTDEIEIFLHLLEQLGKLIEGEVKIIAQ